MSDEFYRTPANVDSKGGKRQIFFNDKLAESITTCESLNELKRKVCLHGEKMEAIYAEKSVMEEMRKRNSSPALGGKYPGFQPNEPSYKQNVGYPSYSINAYKPSSPTSTSSSSTNTSRSASPVSIPSSLRKPDFFANSPPSNFFTNSQKASSVFNSQQPALFTLSQKTGDVFKPTLSSEPPLLNNPPSPFFKEDEETLGKILASDSEPERFVGCNNVFRLNKFSPGDTSFKFHYDTPYVDRKRNHTSLYTILIYLTSGHNPKGVLKIFTNEGPVVFTDIKAGDVIVFDQQFPHIGNPFIEGDKIFLRSELIFEVSNLDLTYNSKAASLFNSACYYQIKANQYSDNELQKYSSSLFNEAMKFRNGHATKKDNTYLYVKQDNVRFLTNGSKYYFTHYDEFTHYSEFTDLCIKLLATIVVKDYLNIRSNSKRTVKKINVNDNPFDFLRTIIFDDEYDYPNDDSDDIIGDPICYCTCPLCNPKGRKHFSSQFQKQYEYATNTLCLKNNCVSVNDKLFLSMDIQDKPPLSVEDKRGEIYFKSFMQDTNFASCTMNVSYDNIYLTEKSAKMYSLPPLSYIIKDNDIIFFIDMFQNGFVYSRPFVYYDIVDDDEDDYI